MARRRNTKAHKHPVTRYALDVLAGEISAGPAVRNQCQRHLDDLERDDLVFDIEAADHALGFFPARLVLEPSDADAELEPFRLLPWQTFVVGSLFGWKFKDDGTRRFRWCYCETGKGSGKSPLAAGIGLYMLKADGEWRAEVYAAATKRDQAKVLFRDAVFMVENHPLLADGLLLTGGSDKNNIAYLHRGSFFRPISSEHRGRGQSGPRPHCAILDEVHEHPSDAMVEFMAAGTKRRKRALIFMITNSGSDRQSVCRRYHDYAQKVCERSVEDDSFFAFLADLDQDDDPFVDESCWQKVNPSLPELPGMKYLREQVTMARGMPGKQNIVKRLNFCIWTESHSAWLGAESWKAIEVYKRKIKSLKNRAAYGGLDLSKKRDLTAFATAVKAPDGGLDCFVEFWTPADTMRERGETDGVDYTTWHDQGFLHATEGRVVDLGFAATRLKELSGVLDYRLVGYDRWYIEQMQAELEEYSVDIELQPFGQGFQDMGPAIDRFEERVDEGSIRVFYNPVLRWNVASAVTVENPAGFRKFNKAKATGRIDGVVALVMAVQVADSNKDVISPWEDPEFTIGTA